MRYHIQTTENALSKISRQREWLTPREQIELRYCRSLTRRNDWLSARFTLKGLVQTHDRGLAWDEISIASRDMEGRGIAPRVYLNGQPTEISASLSHAAEYSMAAIADHHMSRVGCDLVSTNAPATNRTRWRRQWFTEREMRWCEASANPRYPALLWGLKETFYKAAGLDCAFRPMQWDVTRFIGSLRLSLPPYGWDFGTEIRLESSVARLVLQPLENCLALCLGVTQPGLKLLSPKKFLCK